MTVIINNQSLGFCLFSTNFYFLKNPAGQTRTHTKKKWPSGFFSFFFFLAGNKTNKQNTHAHLCIKEKDNHSIHSRFFKKQTNKQTKWTWIFPFSRNNNKRSSSLFFSKLAPPTLSSFRIRITHTHTQQRITRVQPTHAHTHTITHDVFGQERRKNGKPHSHKTNQHTTNAGHPPKNKVGGKIVCVYV